MISSLSKRLVPPVPAREREGRDLPLEGLRGGCALLVLYTHLFAPAHWLDPAYAPSPRFWWFNAGSVAVLFFFVLSGYVIGLTVRTAATGPAVKGYLVRRMMRLVPINTAGVFLVWLLFSSTPWRTLWGNLCFLENARPYFFGWTMPILGNNYNLWSLNYEMVYYLIFVVIWWRAPRLDVLWATTLALGAGAVLINGFPEFISNYACGACFWLVGLSVAWLAPNDRAYGNWPSALLLLLVMWPLDFVNKLLPTVLSASQVARWPALPMNRLEILPVCVWLLLTVTGRGRRWHRGLTVFCLGWAAVALVGGVVLGGDYYNGKAATALYAAVVALACAFAGWSPQPNLLARLAPVGLISFGIYAVALPLEFSLSRQSILPRGTAASFTLRAIVLVVLAVCVAWILERKLQPALRRLLVGRSQKIVRG